LPRPLPPDRALLKASTWNFSLWLSRPSSMGLLTPPMLERRAPCGVVGLPCAGEQRQAGAGAGAGAGRG
jgi:hypothetical protein